MSFEMEFDDDLAQRRLQRLENRHRHAQNALAAARAEYGSLCQPPAASEIRLYQARQKLERAERLLADIRFDIEFLEAQAATPRPPDNDHWRDVGR
jgi:chromosome segregation ATPase